MRTLAVVALETLAAVGCTTPLVKGNPPATTMAGWPTKSTPYVMQVGDALSIKFYRNPELNEDVVVRPDGMISLQLLDDVRAAGLTPVELGAELKRRYTSELANPEVTVIVKTFGGQRVYVSGEVGTQGVQQLAGNTTLFQAVQQAGGFLVSANREQVILIRRWPEGKPTGESIDLTRVEAGTDPQEDVPLQAYDIVFVPKSRIANVNTFVDLYINRNLPSIAPLFLGAALP